MEIAKSRHVQNALYKKLCNVAQYCNFTPMSQDGYPVPDRYGLWGG